MPLPWGRSGTRGRVGSDEKRREKCCRRQVKLKSLLNCYAIRNGFGRQAPAWKPPVPSLPPRLCWINYIPIVPERNWRDAFLENHVSRVQFSLRLPAKVASMQMMAKGALPYYKASHIIKKWFSSQLQGGIRVKSHLGSVRAAIAWCMCCTI